MTKGNLSTSRANMYFMVKSVTGIKQLTYMPTLRAPLTFSTVNTTINKRLKNGPMHGTVNNDYSQFN